ncbi:MAG: DUF1232 domain-containing protein [Candidatus Binatia bacterium]
MSGGGGSPKREGAAARWRRRAEGLRADVLALYLACGDPRVPLHAKVVVACVVAYALSPIDLIPDFVPVLGYLDDLLLLPLGVALAIRLVPPALLEEHRDEARRRFSAGRPTSRTGAVAVVVVWVAVAILAAAIVSRMAR